MTAPEQAPAARGPDVAAVPSSAVQPADPQLAIAIARGREAFTDKDYAAAVIAFDAAALLAPADPRVLSELGWALLHAKDLVRAQSVLSLAVSLASEGRVAGAAWYNLGRVREAQGRRDEAAKAGIIEIYTVDRSEYGWFPNWLKHQKVYKPYPSTLPPPPGWIGVKP